MKILVFAYRRWRSLNNLLASLREQEFKDVIVYVDGNRSTKDFEDVEMSVQVANSYVEYQVVRRPFNWGMYYNIVAGLVSNEDEEVIVLEEDLIVTQLREALNLFPTIWQENLFSIGLMSYLHAKNSNSLEYYELDRFFCWGWYSKKNKIKAIKFNRISLALELSYPASFKHGDLGSMYYNALNRKNNSWAAVVSAGTLSNNLKNIMFRGGFSKNVGFDGENLQIGHQLIFKQYLINKAPNMVIKKKLPISDFWKIHWRFRKVLKVIIYFGKIFTRSHE